MERYLQIVTTIDDEKLARGMAEALVEKRLAACVQVLGPITSVYRWKGRIEKAREWQLLVKTRRELYDAVEQAIKTLHRYETPEIIALVIENGSAEYLGWIEAETTGL